MLLLVAVVVSGLAPPTLQGSSYLSSEGVVLVSVHFVF